MAEERGSGAMGPTLCCIFKCWCARCACPAWRAYADGVDGGVGVMWDDEVDAVL
jgi:hypothetical protein